MQAWCTEQSFSAAAWSCDVAADVAPFGESISEWRGQSTDDLCFAGVLFLRAECGGQFEGATAEGESRALGDSKSAIVLKGVASELDVRAFGRAVFQLPAERAG